MNKHLDVLFINIDLILRITELTFEIHRFEQIYQMVSVCQNGTINLLFIVHVLHQQYLQCSNF